ncbi:hemolysin-type calcium-binding protein [Gemmobacter aquarius]|uniref:Hemolysin-type calcium-binding protein n=1 Tax=Paragemmobacter aquarius TaxID=2169400 RepID=A0A2S0UPT2_9RHOB|nr:Hint domain-containing protein [Gemmobacter aquarius]AWB49816.1 hemolysin-type calcium-binding protein [Gemmobacter aquarius]
MKTGSRGTFVISWAQTEVDGLAASSLGALTVGVVWRWTGDAVRVDRPNDTLLLELPEGKAEMQKRAARMVRRLVGAALGRQPLDTPEAAEDEDAADQGFIVTDGTQSFSIILIEVPSSGARLLMFFGDVPPKDRDLWVVRTQIDRTHTAAGHAEAGGVICFTPDTLIATPSGSRLIRSLRPGDRVLTKDNGPAEILWSGSRRMTGARLYAMPHLRPVRFRSGAFGVGRPEPDLLVSPQHRMLLRGPSAQALFNTPEVLVRAQDLLNDLTVTVDYAVRDVTYVHILLERHNIVFANGLETESFHPSNTALDMIEPDQREGLLALMPGIEANPQSYGDYARRNLSASEASILRHDIAA